MFSFILSLKVLQSLRHTKYFMCTEDHHLTIPELKAFSQAFFQARKCENPLAFSLLMSV